MMNASKAAAEMRITHITAPSMVLMRSKDPDFKNPEAEANWVADNLHGDYIIVKDAGHYPHTEIPEITGGLVLSFFEKLRKNKELYNVTKSQAR
jgi:pimeloyl-ACP methyl ester carboxylesterase